VRSLIAVVAGGLVGVAMAFRGYGVWSLVGQQLVNGLVQVLVLWWASDWRPGFKVSARHFRELFSFGINLVGVRILDFINSRSDDFLIGYFLGPVALGYYSTAYRLYMILIQLLTNVTNQVAIPAFSRLQQEPERLRQAFYTVTQLTSFISFPAFLGLAALAPELIRVLFGEQWLPSIPVMQILAFLGVFVSLYYFNASVMIAMGKPFWKVMLSFINGVANAVAFAIVVRWGIVAVAAACVIRFYLLAPFELWAVQKLIHIKYTTYFRQCIAPLIGSLVMVGTIMVIKQFLNGRTSLYVILVVCILMGTLVYTGIILLIAPTLKRQIFDLVESVLQIKKKER
jgi:PST family polysaccharide transporter